MTSESRLAGWSLRNRILLGMLAYIVLLSIAVAIQGQIVNEHAERLVWQNLLDAELDHYLERRQAEPGFVWKDTKAIAIYDGSAGHPIPPELRSLTPGLHDDLQVGDGMRVVQVREVDGRPLVVSLDITALEEREVDMALTVAGSAITLIALLALAVALSLNRLLQPLSSVARQIGQLRPDLGRQRIDLPPSATRVLVMIADSLNGYLQRHEQFVQRERAFIDSANLDVAAFVEQAIRASFSFRRQQARVDWSRLFGEHTTPRRRR